MAVTGECEITQSFYEPQDITDVTFTIVHRWHLYELVNQDSNKGRKRKLERKWNSATPLPFVWNQKHQEAFDALKNALTTAPVLGFADFIQPLIWRQMLATKELYEYFYTCQK